MSKEAFEETLYQTIGLASWELISTTQKIGYINQMYKSSDLKKLRKTATRLSAMITADIFGKAEAIDKRKFAKHLGKIEDFL